MKIHFLVPVLLVAMSASAQQSPTKAPLEGTETEALLTVLVYNSKEQPQAGESVSFVSKKNKKAYSGMTDANGKFQLLVPEGDTYSVNYLRFADEKQYDTLNIPSMDGIIEFDYTIHVQEIVKTYTLNNVHFDVNKSSLRPDSYPELNNLAEFLNNKKNVSVEIAGHTDSDGDDDANMKLSQSRAETVKKYLEGKGVAADRITAKGYGETSPVATNDTEEGRAKNRRTEVRITKQ